MQLVSFVDTLRSPETPYSSPYYTIKTPFSAPPRTLASMVLFAIATSDISKAGVASCDCKRPRLQNRSRSYRQHPQGQPSAQVNVFATNCIRLQYHLFTSPLTSLPSPQ
eukprot:5279185-Pleurochrysis_carterae.AAC.2